MSVESDVDYDPIEDVDNLNQKMQIRAINEARGKVRRVRNQAQEQIASATPDQRARAERGGKRIYLQVLKAYALELAPLIAEHEQGLWSDTALIKSTMRYRPSNDERDIKAVEPLEHEIVVNGVMEFVTTEFPVSRQYRVTYKDTAKGDDNVVRVQRWQPSFSQIDVVLLEIDNARKSLGIYLEGPDEVGVESDEPV